MKSRTLIQSMVLLAAALLIPFRLFGQFASFNDQAFLAQGGGNSLLTGLVAAWHFDEQVTSGNRVDAASGITWYDFGNNVGSLRGVIGGAASITNGAGNYLSVTNSQFRGTSGFTLAFWVIGGNANNSWIGQKQGDGSAADWFVDEGKFQVISGGVGKTINLTLPVPVWNFVVVGFDGTQIFASVNGAAKTTLACPSVDATANMPFLNRWILGGVDEVNFWSRALSSSEITTLYNGGFGNPYPYTQTDPGVLFEAGFGWAVTNAGVTLGNTSSNALVGLIDGCVADGTWSGLSYCLPFVSDNLTAALLPLVAPKKQDQNISWIYPVNHGLVSGDLTVNGLAGDGVAKYLDTGFNASTAISSQNSASLALYAYTANSAANAHDCSTLSAGATSGFITFSAIGGNAGTRISDIAAGATAVTQGNGYYCGSRTAANRIDLYFANSTTPHASVVNSVVGATLALPNLNSPIFALNNNGVIANFSNSRLSMVSFASGFSSAQSQAFYNRVQAYRVAVGGGFR